MRYLSVCAGIEAATVAWHPLGWEAAAFSEIEAFPRAVLAHHYPEVPLHGDFTTIGAEDYGAIDLLVGGTPCQSFSIAGLRGGLADDRGNLALEFLRLADRKRPRWVVWENVPGVFSSLSHDTPDLCPPAIDLDAGDGPADGEEVVVEDSYDADESHAFSCFLAGLSELGYGVAYRVLDAQFAGVPQRRRRVFAVGYLGDWRRAAAVLFERHSLSGYSAPRREAGKGVARPIAAGSQRSSGCRNDADTAENLICGTVSSKWAKGSGGPSGDECQNLLAVPEAIQERAVSENLDAGPQGKCWQEDCAYTLEARNKVQSVAFSIMPMNSGKDYKARETDVAQPIMEGGPVGGNQGGDFVCQSVAFADTYNGSITGDVSATLGTQSGDGVSSGPSVLGPHAVRRLTPRECERLQGFPDDYTLIPVRGKPAADGPRYKALGNSMAVPVMRWIGERIAAADAISQESQAA